MDLVRYVDGDQSNKDPKNRVVIGEAEILGWDEHGMKVQAKVTKTDDLLIQEISKSAIQGISLGPIFDNVDVEASIVEPALKQARRYGEQVRDLTHQKMPHEVLYVHAAWTSFRRGLMGMDNQLYDKAVTAYLAGYDNK